VKRLVVFDLDGTLVDSSQDLASALNATLRQLAPGKPPLTLPAVRSMIGHGARQLVEQGLLRAGVSAHVDEVLPLFIERYRGCLLDTTRLYPGVREGLVALHGRTLAVLSNKPGDLCRTILAGLGVAQLFARIAGGGDLPGRKPDPEVLRALMAQMGEGPAETVMVGDSAVDVRTARAAGVRVFGVAWGLDPAGLASEPPDAILKSLLELAELC
jgi:phosphoglycolate phosphatase